MSKKRVQVYLALLLTTIIWGISAPVIKLTLKVIPPFTFLFLRFFISSVIIFPFFVLHLGKNPISKKEFFQTVLLGFLGTTATLTLVFLGLEKTSSLDGSILIAVNPILIVIGGALFLKEEVTRTEKLGLTLALLGTLVTIFQPIFEKGVFATENFLGNISIILSNLTWAAFALISKRVLAQIKPFTIVSISFFVGLLSFAPFSFSELSPFFSQLRATGTQPSYQIVDWASFFPVFGVFYMAIFSSLIGFFCYNFGLSFIEASEAALFTYLQPLFASPFAFWWLGESLTFPFLFGAGLIGLGVLLTTYRPKRV